MKHIVIDLEMNPISERPEISGICAQEIIEIGAVMLDDEFQEISSFRTYVKPQYNDGIQDNITTLTGITNDMVENAPYFNEAAGMFAQWCMGTGSDIKIYAWSESDYSQMIREMALKRYAVSENEAVVFGNKWTDFQNEFDAGIGFGKCTSLKSALEMAGIDFSGRQHDALDDARNTADLFRVFRGRRDADCRLTMIEEVMKPPEFVNSIGSLVDFSKLGILEQ